jgi:hypothetical protein
VGYGDIAPVSELEMVFAMGIMAFGVFLYSYALGSLIHVWRGMNTRTVQYRKRMSIFHEVVKEMEVNKVLLSKLKKAIKYGINKSNSYKKKFFEELPINLKTELMILMNKKQIKTIGFFQVRCTEEPLARLSGENRSELEPVLRRQRGKSL